MKPFIKALLTLLLTLTTLAAYGQQNPPGIEWKYIDAGHYRIIFPAGLEELAQRTADLMVFYEPYNYADYDTSPRYIPIVLVSDYADSNGFVSFAPLYSHWFTTPSSFAAGDWITGLAIHEGRHMVQINRLQEGAGKYAWYLLFGNYGTAVFQGLFMPGWYIEGDAVVMETALTDGGRGRLPYFNLWYRGIELYGEHYSYYRSYLGTYDDMYPWSSDYGLGYLLCAYIRRHYGKEALDRIMTDTGKYFAFYTFDRSVQFETGKNVREIYNDAMEEYREYWEKNLEGLAFTCPDRLSPERTNTWESYLFPFASQNGTYAMRFARDRKLALVRITPDGADEIMLMPYSTISPIGMNERDLTAGGDFVLWKENVPDMRWGYQSWSDLKLYRISTGETLDLTGHGKFLSSALSPDGLYAAGIEYTASAGYSLSLFSTESMKLISHQKLNGMGHIFDPAISPDSRHIALCANRNGSSAIILFDTSTGKTETIAGYTRLERFKTPVFYDRWIFYVSDFTGIDNIYAIEVSTKKRYQVTSMRFGAYFPSVSAKDSTLLFNEYTVSGYIETGAIAGALGLTTFNEHNEKKLEPGLIEKMVNSLVMNEYTESGYKASSIKIDPSKWIPVEKLKKPDDPFLDAIRDQEIGPERETPGPVPENKYEIKDYNTLTDGMTSAGWYYWIDSTNKDISVNLSLQDVLNTTSIGTAYIHNYNEGTDAGNLYITYSGLYPVLNISTGYGNRAVHLDENEYSGTEPEYMTWKEATFTGDIAIPLNLSRGIHEIYLKVGAGDGIIDISDKTNTGIYIYNDMNSDGMLNYAFYYLQFSHTITGALNSRTPRWGEILNVSYYHTPWSPDYNGSLFSADMTIYLPWFFDTHGIRFTGCYEFLDYDNYRFSSMFLFPRGYDEVSHRHLVKGGIDYMFPIADFSLPVWKLVYFKRINGTIFFDYGTGITHGEKTEYPSAGFELTSVQNLLSNPYLVIEAGLRYSRCIETGENRYDFMLTTPLN